MNISRLKELGKEWHTEKYHRIYFNDLNKLAGLEISRDISGTIPIVKFKGKNICNALAKAYYADKYYSKLWYDCLERKFKSKHLHKDMRVSAIKTILKTMGML